jgi:hypothetical protein
MGSAGAARQGTSVALSGDGRVAVVGGSADHGSFGATRVFVVRARRATQTASAL